MHEHLTQEGPASTEDAMRQIGKPEDRVNAGSMALGVAIGKTGHVEGLTPIQRTIMIGTDALYASLKEENTKLRELVAQLQKELAPFRPSTAFPAEHLKLQQQHCAALAEKVQPLEKALVEERPARHAESSAPTGLLNSSKVKKQSQPQGKEQHKRSRVLKSRKLQIWDWTRKRIRHLKSKHEEEVLLLKSAHHAKQTLQSHDLTQAHQQEKTEMQKLNLQQLDSVKRAHEAEMQRSSLSGLQPRFELRNLETGLAIACIKDLEKAISAIPLIDPTRSELQQRLVEWTMKRDYAAGERNAIQWDMYAAGQVPMYS